jgi:hypothetical protein
MKQAKHFVDAPRIQVVLTPDEKEANINAPSALFDLWIVLHVPDGKPPTTVQVDGGPFNRDGAIDRLLEVYTEIGDKFAVPTAKIGMISSADIASRAAARCSASSRASADT